jgi:hypothetical protein
MACLDERQAVVSYGRAVCLQGHKGGRFKATLERSDTWRLAENVTVARRERPDE